MPTLLSQPDQCDDSKHLTVFTSTQETIAIHIASNHSGTANHFSLVFNKTKALLVSSHKI